jgi:hypothetical protein
MRFKSGSSPAAAIASLFSFSRRSYSSAKYAVAKFF